MRQYKRADEAKERYREVSIPQIMNGLLLSLRAEIADQVTSFQRELTPSLRRILSRAERETARKIVKQYFEAVSEKVLRYVKHAVSKSLQSQVREKVQSEMTIYKYRIREATPELERQLQMRQRQLIAVKTLHSMVQRYIKVMRSAQQTTERLESSVAGLRELMGHLKSYFLKHPLAPRKDHDSDEDEQVEQALVTEIMHSRGY